MVFIWGTKGYGDFLGYIIFECPSCKTTCPFSVEQVKKKFTVYFIPTFSYSNTQYLTCTSCNASFKIPKELKPEVAKNLMSQEELSSLIQKANKENKKKPELEKPNSKKRINYCPNCGSSISEEMNFCKECGKKIR
jgi:hypothetical protein